MKFISIIENTALKADSWLAKPNIKTFLFLLTIAICFLLILAQNLLQPIFFDDWAYAFVSRDENTHERLQSIGDIFRSQYEHYFTWGGRSVAHAIAQFLLLIGSPWSKILNSLAYIALIYVIYRHAKGPFDKNTDISLFIVINILLWFFLIDYSANVLWITGSANYLWCTLIILLFLLPYRWLLDDKQKSDSILKMIFFLFAGIIAGWTNENMGGAMIFIIAVLLGYMYYTKKQIPKWALFGLAGAIIGFVIMVMAPGNYVRYDIKIMENNFTDTPRLIVVLLRFGKVLSGIFFFLFSLLCLYCSIGILSRFFPKYRNIHINKTTTISVAYLVTGILGAFAMSFALSFPPRAWFGIIVFIILALCVFYANIDFKQPFLKHLKYVVLSFAVIATLGYYFQDYKDIAAASAVFAKREKYIEEQKKLGVKDFVFDFEIHPNVRKNNLHDLYRDPGNWHNVMYSRYYGINSVIVLRPDCE